jgi:hypothetical protein
MIAADATIPSLAPFTQQRNRFALSLWGLGGSLWRKSFAWYDIRRAQNQRPKKQGEKESEWTDGPMLTLFGASPQTKKRQPQ